MSDEQVSECSLLANLFTQSHEGASTIADIIHDNVVLTLFDVDRKARQLACAYVSDFFAIDNRLIENLASDLGPTYRALVGSNDARVSAPQMGVDTL